MKYYFYSYAFNRSATTLYGNGTVGYKYFFDIVDSTNAIDNDLKDKGNKNPNVVILSFQEITEQEFLKAREATNDNIN